MDNVTKTPSDSLPPMSAPAMPRTLPPKPIRRRHLYILSTIIVHGAAIFAAALTYWLLLDPQMGEYRLYGALLAGCTLLSSAVSFAVNVLLYKEIKERRR